MKKDRIGVLIAAAGMSRRMGEPKQLMKIGPLTFLQHIITRFQSIEPDEIVVVTGYKAEETRASLEGLPVTFLHNPDYETTQMFDSVSIGLNYLQDRCDRFFFTPVDVPLFEEETLLMEMACAEDAVLPISGGRIGHPILLRSSCVSKLLSYQGNRGLKGALDELRKDQIYYLPTQDRCGSLDADTPEDAERLLRLNQAEITRKAAVFGAGQAGTMLLSWLPAETEVCCFLDNDPDKAGTNIAGIPVVSPEELLQKDIDTIYLAAAAHKRESAQHLQLRQLGYKGRIVPLSTLREHLDLRLAALRRCAQMIRERGIKGNCAELGVFRGDFAREISRCFPECRLYLFDTFEGFDERDLAAEKEKVSIHPDFHDTSVSLVLSRLPHPEQAVIIKGYFPRSLQDCEDGGPYCFVSLDCDLEIPTYEGLKWFWPRMEEGGIILINDYRSRQFPGVKTACDRYCQEHDLFLLPLADIHGSVILLKQGGCHE